MKKIIFLCSCLCLSVLANNAGATNLYWDNNGTSAAGNGTWATTGNDWATSTTLTASATTWGSGDFAEFSAGTATTALTITVSGTVTCAGMYDLTASGLTFNGTGTSPQIAISSGVQGFFCEGGNITINVPLTGSGGVEQEGSGYIALYATNTYSGGTTTTGGQVTYYNNNSSFGTGTITISESTGQALVNGGSAGIVIANNFSFPTAGFALNLAGGAPSGSTPGTTFSGTFSLPSSGTTTLETGGAGQVTEISGVMSGASALSVSDDGTLELGGVNTFSGAITIAASTGLSLVGSGSLGSGSSSQTIANSGFFTNNTSASQTLSGVISGAGKLIQAGAGTLTLSGANTYTGSNTLSGGVVVLNHSETAGTSGPLGKSADANPGFILMSGGTLRYTTANNQHDYSGRFSTAANQAYNVDVNGASVTYASALVSSGGTLTLNSTAGGGALTLSAANSYTGQTTVTGTTLNLANAAGLDAVLGTAPASPVTNQLVLNNATLELSTTALTLSPNRGITLLGANVFTNNGKDITFPENITGTGSLTKTGANAAALSGSNSFSGGLTLLQGTVYFVTNYAAGFGNITVGPTLGLMTLRITNTSPLQTSVTITNSITVNGGGTKLIDMVSASGDILTFSGQISGNGGLYRGNGGGPGNVALTGNNTNWSGGISLQQGGLIVGNPNALGTGTCTFEPVGSGTTAVILQGNTPLTGVNAMTNAVQIAVSNAADQITIGGSTDLELAGPVSLAQAGSLAPVITNNNTGATIISGVISSGVSGTGFTSAGTGILTLNGADTYNGNTTISSGTLALGASGSINSSPVISIAAGATFDTSANAAYALSGSTTLSAGGTASPATINGALGGTVSLGSQPIILAYDGSHPALTISQGTLVLNGNAFTVNGAVLGVGTYTLISQSSGSISSSGSYAVSGSAIAGRIASIQVMGGNVNLVITLETPAFSGLTASPSITYGTPTVTLSGTLSATSPTIIYPASNETVTVTINGNAQTTTINDTNGDFSINYNLAGLIYSTSAYPITYSYAGDAALYGATNTSTTLTVTPATAPGITNNPSPQTACGGSPATFTAGASGTNDTYAWYNHANAGWGSAWSATGGGGTFLASSTGNNNGAPDCNTFGSNGDINTPGGNSWGIYGGGSGESVTRTFPAALTDGQVFQVDMDNGGVANGVQNGFSLQNTNGGFLFSFYFQGGGSDYVFYDGNGATDTGVGYTVTGVRVQVIVGAGSPAAYSLLITPCGGSTVEFSGTFATTNGPGQVTLFNNNPYGGSANDLYFNSMFAGAAYDNADNYTNGGWNGVDAGDAAPIAGATNATYTTSSGNNGDLYYAIVGNGAGFAASTTALLTVNPPPTVSVNSATLCAGGSAMLTATTSASSPSYLWSDSETTASITVSPASTTVYTVTVTDGTTGCMNNGSGTVTVNPLPTVSVNSAAVCVGGGPTTLTATTSASNPSYLWSDSETNASITVSPGSTTTYTVTVTDGTTGCANSGSGTVTVNPLPTVSVNSATLCAGGSATLTATTSASSPSYLWSDSETTASITVSPASTTTYTVTVTDGTTGCMNSGSGTVTINPLPTITLGTNAILVDYGSTNAGLAYTGTSGSPDGYSITYDTNAQAAGFSNVTLTALPASPITLTVPAIAAGTNAYNGTLTVYYSSNGCGSTNYEFTVTVTPLPVNLTGARAYDGTNDANSSILTIANDLDGTNLTLSGSAVLAGSGLGPQSISDFSGLALGGSAATNYMLAGASGSVTISAATPAFSNLTASQAITYGTASITLTGTVSAPGPVYPTNGETITVTINGNPQTTTISDGMGDFTINYSSATLPVVTSYPGNYAITYSYGGDTVLTGASDTSTTLEVDARSVLLVGTRMYDGMTDAAAAILSVANAINGDMVTVASGSATLVSANVGTNAILATGTLQLGGSNAGNYNITGGVGTVVVTMAPLTITANNDSKVYGQVKTYGAGSGAFTSSALQNGETIGTVTITASGGTAANAPIGTYNLFPSAATGGTFSPGNYAITYNPGTLTVSVLTAILTGTRPYDGTAIATNSILTVSNAVAGDDVTVASGSGTLASDAVGTNLITSLGSLALGGTTATNYTLSGATGAVVITDSGLPFSITTFTLVGTNLVTVFQSIPGDVYQLLGSASAAAPLATWTNVGGSITATNTSTTNIIPVDTLNNSQSYIYKNLR